MKPYNIERNKLDYFLTDLLPVELTELFSLNGFYKFLHEHNDELDDAIHIVRKFIENNSGIPFEQGWATIPLKYNILKGNDGQREMSLMQPLSMLNVYLFLECYQKEILIHLEKNSVFSLRYHKKSSNLYYRKRVKKITEYYQSTAKSTDRAVLQQTGAYFRIHRYNSVSSFTGSSNWQRLNFKYSHFARLDYKSCFDSIYSHSFKWIIQKNVPDSKRVKNSNLYTVIDRVLQNINANSSNGVIVGPEFSRMIVEILLQHIDVEVENKLKSEHLHSNEDYNVYRYVDDIFIFANSEATLDIIIKCIADVAQQYLLRPNELKMIKTTTPFTLNQWLSETRILADRMSNLFYSREELSKFSDDNKHLVRDGYLPISKLKDDFNSLICDFPKQKRTIVSFMLSTLLNNISKKKNGILLFKSEAKNRAFYLLDLALYILSFCPCFDHVQRIISMIVYFDAELCFHSNDSNHEKLENLLSKYMFIMKRGNLNDLCNMLLLFHEYSVVMPYSIENDVWKRIRDENNPLLLGVFLIYSRHYPLYFQSTLDEVESIILSNINHITDEDVMLQKEFWFVLVFCNCPFLSSNLKGKLRDILQSLYPKKLDRPSDIMIKLLVDYLLSGRKNLFFTWGVHRFSVSKQIAFRTYQRSVFREYRHKNSPLFDSSLS